MVTLIKNMKAVSIWSFVAFLGSWSGLMICSHYDPRIDVDLGVAPGTFSFEDLAIWNFFPAIVIWSFIMLAGKIWFWIRAKSARKLAK